MSDWREKFKDVADDGVVFAMDMRIDVTRQGAAFLSQHARSLGMQRSDWVRLAIIEQLRREGIEEIPEMKPYKGWRLRMAVDGKH